MKSSKIRALAVAVAASSACLLASGAAVANSVVFEGVTIDLSASGGFLTLTLTGVGSSTGTWANAAYLDAFSLKDYGSANLNAPSGFTESALELNASGCAGGGSGGSCFSGHEAADNSITLKMSYTGALDMTAPHLKLYFVDGEGEKVGSLYSAAVPVPEPETYALMLAGLGVVGFMARRRRQG